MFDVGPYVLGCFYTRPLTKINTSKLGQVVLPILHTHMGDISRELHHHVDMRFISDYKLRKLGMASDVVFGVEPNTVFAGKVRCYRTHVPMVRRVLQTAVEDFAKLEVGQLNNRVTCNKCPHQGCDLSAVLPCKVNGEKVVVCPCHGLQWSVQTGKLVPRSHLGVKE